MDGPRVSDNADRIWRVIDYIFDNCNRKLTLKEVADREFITETYLSRILKKETGLNFEETLAYLRAECSIRYLLEDDDRTVKPRFYMQKIFNEIGESAQHI